MRRSAINAAGRMIKRADEAWAEGKMAAAVMMHIQGVFPSIAKENLIESMDDMGFEAYVCRWTESCMSDRKATIQMDRWEGEMMSVEMDVPQRLLVSPILFNIYISDLFFHLERTPPRQFSQDSVVNRPVLAR